MGVGVNSAQIETLWRTVVPVLKAEHPVSLMRADTSGVGRTSEPARAQEPAMDDFTQMVLACVSAVAVDTLAPRRAKRLAIVGSGVGARLHALAALSVRDLEDIRIFDRRLVAARELGRFLRAQSGVTAHLLGSEEEAVAGADIIIVATPAGFPRIDADWVAGDAFVISAGPKTRTRHEVALSLAARARVIASDNVTNLVDLGPNFFLAHQSAGKRVGPLGKYIGKFDTARDIGVTIFLASDAPAALATLRADKALQAELFADRRAQVPERFAASS